MHHLYQQFLFAGEEGANVRKDCEKLLSASPVYTGSSHWVIEAMESYVNSYYNREIKLSQLANLYFLNPQYLCRLFTAKCKSGFEFLISKPPFA